MLRIGYFKHWFQPPYSYVTFLKEKMNVDVQEINFRKKGYLDNLDVAIIEQHGFNDFIENDEEYVRNFVKNGGICCFMAQDYRRWAKYFLPDGIGYPILIDRYINTIRYDVNSELYQSYMMPEKTEAGEALFSIPEQILPEELLFWKLQVNSFGIAVNEREKPDSVMTTALSCAIQCDGWEILAAYRDAAISDGALILQKRYGKGMYFISQLLFPEVVDDASKPVFEFWKKYTRNLLAHFERFVNDEPAVLPATANKQLPVKRNYRTAIHIHALDWFGADHSVAVLQALMRHQKFDIAAIGIKDPIPYGGVLDLAKYSDDKILLIHGQEYHPFNWTDVNEKYGHNCFHMLAMGIDGDAYTPRFTRSIFSNEDIEAYQKEAVDYIHSHGGVACATHPYFDSWFAYPYDAVDHEPLLPLAGTVYERFYLSGRKIAMMNSVDLWGVQRLLDNPAANFIYIQGTPSRDSFVAAIKAGHTIAACHFMEADITLGNALPGDEVSAAVANEATVKIHAVAADNVKCSRVRVFAADAMIEDIAVNSQSVDMEIPLAGRAKYPFVRVEIEGDAPNAMLVSTPFYVR